MPNNRGTALLAVLWLTAALSAIAFTVASSVRAETERVSTETDSLRSYYLATGAVKRAMLWVQWGQSNPSYPDGRPMFYRAPMPRLHFEFPNGRADVEMIPETSKLDINLAKPEELSRLLGMLGTPADRAAAIVPAIVDWRKKGLPDETSIFDQYYLSLTPPFRSRHASFEDIEELLFVRGMTPEIFYGGYRAGEGGSLAPYGGLRDCVSVYGSASRFDINTAPPGILAMLGLNPVAIQGLLKRREAGPILALGDVAVFFQGAPGAGRLTVGGLTIWTLRATAQLRLANGQFSDLRRSVSAMVKFLPSTYDPPYHILRWYDDAVPFTAALPQGGETVTPIETAPVEGSPEP